MANLTVTRIHVSTRLHISTDTLDLIPTTNYIATVKPGYSEFGSNVTRSQFVIISFAIPHDLRGSFARETLSLLASPISPDFRN